MNPATAHLLRVSQRAIHRALAGEPFDADDWEERIREEEAAREARDDARLHARYDDF